MVTTTRTRHVSFDSAHPLLPFNGTSTIPHRRSHSSVSVLSSACRYEWAKRHLAEEKEARKLKEAKGEKPMATRMWTQKDTERLHQMFKQEWDKTHKGPKSKWHAYTALLFKRSKRAIQGKWYEWAKVAGIGLRAWPKVEGDGRLSGGAMLSDSSDDSEGEFPVPPADDEAAADGEQKESDLQTGEHKESDTAMTDAATGPASAPTPAPATASATSTDGEKLSEKLARKRRREERRTASSGPTTGATSTHDTLRLSPSDFQHILELRVGGINFGTLLVSSGDQPAAVQLVYKEGQTVTWNNPAFPLPSPPVGSTNAAAAAVAASAGSSSASPPAAGSAAGKAE